MSRARARILLLVLLICGGELRLLHVNWDEGHHLQPDERFISMVEEHLAWPASPAQYFDSLRSPLNPYNRGHGSFVYGTVPVVLAKAVEGLVGKPGYDTTYLVGRRLSALFDLLTVLLVYRVARRFAGRRTSLTAAGLLAFCAFSIQLSHFWSSDTFLTTFSVGALLGSVRIAQNRSGWASDAATGACIGLATACKVTALALLLPLGVAVLITSLAMPRRPWRPWILRHAGRLLLILLAAVASVRVALPTAFLGPSPLSLRLDPRWVNDLRNLASLSRSVAGYPPALQWAGRTFFFPIRNFVLWGAGMPFGITALISLGWGLLAWRRKMRPMLVLAAYALFVFLYHGFTMVKTMRYFYPAYPALAVLAALGVHTLQKKGVGSVSGILRRVPQLLLAATAVWALAFVSIYLRPNTRVAASLWIYEHVPPALFANETWDDGLPFPMPGYDNARYSGPMLDLWGPDNSQKVGEILRVLGQTDWIAITSGRVYMNITRLPMVFPMTSAYYRALFEGRLGFDRVDDFTSYPSLGPLRFPDDTAEEQFTVYDHPRVLLFRKAKNFSRDRVRQILLAPLATTPPSVAEWEKLPRSKRRVTASLLPDVEPAAVRPLKGEASEETVSSWWAALLFYVAASIAGLFAFPIVWKILPRLSDRGAGVARTFGIVLASYLLALLVNLRILSSGRGAALFCLALLAAAGALVFLRHRRDLLAFTRERRPEILQGELVFAAGFLLFLALRALNPEIAWGEKPMDFSILNILVRTRTLPPSDPWFAGSPLGYYYLGQEMVAWLTLVTGLSTRYTFNLAFGLIGGLTLQGAFTLLRNWAGNLRAAIAGSSFVGILGNLAGLREWLINRAATDHHRPLDWNYFWATSRVIKDTVNEYPFWTLVFADLHAHVLAFPLFLLLATAALHFVRVHADPTSSLRERVVSAVLLGLVTAVQALTNAWDVPLLAGLLVLLLLVAALGRRRFEPIAAGRAFLSFLLAGSIALASALPLWVRGGGLPGYGRSMARDAARGIDVLTMFGLFFFLALAWWMSSARRRMTEEGKPRKLVTAILVAGAIGLAVLAVVAPTAFCVAGVLLFLAAAVASRGPAEDRLAFGFLATAFFLVFFPQRFYIYDRMNTFFKLYIEAWFLFSIGTAVLVFRPADRPGSFMRWKWPLRTGFYTALALALFTTVTVALGAIDRTTSPAAREGAGAGWLGRYIPQGGPSLDGLRYLERTQPGEYRAVLWLRRAIRGTPVVLEAQGPSYQDFGRISMLTGLPTVLGWEYHVQQRGNPPAEITARVDAVKRIYSAPDSSGAEALLRRYHVAYVYVGWLERQTYPSASLTKLDHDPDLFALVYENHDARIYRVAGSESQDVLIPTHEKVEAPAGASAPDTEPEEPPNLSEKPIAGVPPFGGMREPRDAAVDARGRIWIADFGNSRLRLFDPEGGFLGGWGGRGAGTFGLREPCGVATDDDDLYVADTWNGRIQHYTVEGAWKSTVLGLYGPRGVAIGTDRTVWVTDTGNHRVVHYSPDLQEIAAYGKKGPGPQELSNPVGIAVNSTGLVYVADTGNRRVSVLDPARGFQRPIPFPGWKAIGEPDLEVGPEGKLFVTDPGADCVVELDPSGEVLARWNADDAHRAFSRPSGVAIDRRRSILYIVNSGNNSVSSLRLPERKSP